MTAGRNDPSRSKRGGQTLIEFCLVAILLTMILLSTVETGRMILVYTSVATSARAGLRYAMVHGSSRSGTGVNGSSGPAGNPAQVVTVIQNFASLGALNTGLLVITVAYPSASNAPGETVNVTVVYPYDPFTAWFPFRMRLGSTAQGVIIL